MVSVEIPYLNLTCLTDLVKPHLASEEEGVQVTREVHVEQQRYQRPGDRQTVSSRQTQDVVVARPRLATGRCHFVQHSLALHWLLAHLKPTIHSNQWDTPRHFTKNVSGRKQVTFGRVFFVYCTVI